MKIRVLNVLPHEPDYRFKVGDPRPPVHWDTPDGSWVGIYRNEIPNKLAKEVLRYTDAFEYEVWQGDYRADKVYSHTFEDGETHRLFPAHQKRERYGLKHRAELHSPAMVNYLIEYSRQHPVVINLNGGFLPLNVALLEVSRHLPVLQTFRGTLHLPKTMALRLRRNFPASLTYLRKHWEAQRVAPHVDYVTYQNSEYYQDLAKLLRVPKAKLTSGCDFAFWKSQPQDVSRKALELPAEKTIFLISSLLILRKQIDHLIRVLRQLDDRYDFLLIISGHGSESYEQYLRELAQPLVDKEKAKFVGYITGEELRHYYNAADLFINPSASEGGPVSSMKALACETPVFSTDSGNVAERMAGNGSGILVSAENYAQWRRALAQFMDGAPVRPFDRDEAEAHYDWQKIAAQFAKIYHQLALRYNLYPTTAPSLPEMVG